VRVAKLAQYLFRIFEGIIMDKQRRQAISESSKLVLGLAVSAGLLPVGYAQSAATSPWNEAAFTSKTVDDTARALGGAVPTESADIVLYAPDISENGGVVPIQIKSNIPNTQQLAVLVEKNPNALVAVFDVPAGTEADVLVRIKMGQTSTVYALVKADGKYYYVGKEVKVTLGGCGG
jgi:sulfur-oxidizing protein SoxY